MRSDFLHIALHNAGKQALSQPMPRTHSSMLCWTQSRPQIGAVKREVNSEK
jgi:hypothetical protein